MKKRVGHKKIVLVLVPALMGLGCTPEPEQQRDVYKRVEDCMIDWGDAALCTEMAKAEAQQFAASSQGDAAVQGGSSVFFWGPSYYPGERSVDYNGRTYHARSYSGLSQPYRLNANSSAAARRSPGMARQSAASRGGFGGSGRSFSSGG